jgi:hypothetical protein
MKFYQVYRKKNVQALWITLLKINQQQNNFKEAGCIKWYSRFYIVKEDKR